jgi:hypothetical protein
MMQTMETSIKRGICRMSRISFVPNQNHNGTAAAAVPLKWQ